MPLVPRLRNLDLKQYQAHNQMCLNDERYLLNEQMNLNKQNDFVSTFYSFSLSYQSDSA